MLSRDIDGHLEAECLRLNRRIGWALRRKDAARAERLECELAATEARRLSERKPRHPYSCWLDIGRVRA